MTGRILPLALSAMLLCAIALAQNMPPNTTPQPGMANSGAVQDSCAPACRYVCDPAPECPATCKPICKKPPECDVQCDGLGAATCTVNCMDPECQVECEDNYSGTTAVCPNCRNVCAEPKCEVKCDNPVPECKPKCDEPYCEWECAKPPSCAKPKCRMVCDTVGSCHGCCNCNDHGNAMAAIELAATTHPGALPAEELRPSFLEVAHHAHYMSTVHGQTQCCPCASKPMIDPVTNRYVLTQSPSFRLK